MLDNISVEEELGEFRNDGKGTVEIPIMHFLRTYWIGTLNKGSQ